MKNLYLFSNNYPYGNGETFLADEITFLSKVFDNVFVTPLWGCGEKRVVSCKNIIFNEPILGFNPKQRSKLIKKGLFNRASIPNFFSEIINGKGNLKKKLWITITSTLVIRCLLASDNFIKIAKSIDNDDVCYFYWGDMTANALPFIKKINKHTFKSVARFHGSDLYDEAKGFIPFRKQLLNSLDVVCTISKNGFDYLDKKFPSIHNKLILCKLGSKDNGMETYQKQDILHILTCSNIVELKRLYIVAEALKLIKDKNIEWIHIGDGPLKNNVIEITKTFPDNISADFKGQMKHEELLDFIKNSSFDVFINVSRSEGVPVTIMESISFGIPVIATDVGGTSEIVNENTGVLISKDITPDELKDTLINYLNMNDEAFLKLRKSSRSEWETHWNMDNNYKVFAEFISNH